DIGANPVWFQMAANPKYYYPVQAATKYDVSFVGSAYAKRIHYVNQLISDGINVDCFGPNWRINKPFSGLKFLKKELNRFSETIWLAFMTAVDKRYFLSSKIQYYDALRFLRKRNAAYCHYPVTDEQMVDIFNRTKINLGFLEVFSEDNRPQKSVYQH